MEFQTFNKISIKLIKSMQVYRRNRKIKFFSVETETKSDSFWNSKSWKLKLVVYKKRYEIETRLTQDKEKVKQNKNKNH